MSGCGNSKEAQTTSLTFHLLKLAELVAPNLNQTFRQTTRMFAPRVRAKVLPIVSEAGRASRQTLGTKGKKVTEEALTISKYSDRLARHSAKDHWK